MGLRKNHRKTMETKSFKYKIYKLNENKQKRLEELMRTAAWVYNHSLAVMRTYYRLYGKSISQARMQAHIAKMKHRCYPKWNDLNAQCSQQILDRIYEGYKKFFNKTAKHPPKFKNWRRYSSITYKQDGYTLNGNTLTLNKQKLRLRFHLSRPIEGKIQTVCVSRDAVGDWWVSFTVRVNDTLSPTPPTGKAIGLDFGLHHFLTGSDGRRIESPQFLKENLDDLRKRQRDLSRKEKGSNSRKRARLEVARLHRRISNQRTAFHWQLANELAKEFDIICIETLDIKSMQERWGRKIGDLAFSDFVEILATVCKKNGKRLVQIDKWEPTSKTCSVCGHKAEDLPLNIRKWMCPECGTRHDRDVNAAQNILKIGMGTPP